MELNVNTIIMGERYGTDGVNYPTDENNLQKDTYIGFSIGGASNAPRLIYPTDTTKYFERTDSDDPYMHDYIIDTYSWGYITKILISSQDVYKVYNKSKCTYIKTRRISNDKW